MRHSGENLRKDTDLLEALWRKFAVGGDEVERRRAKDVEEPENRRVDVRQSRPELNLKKKEKEEVREEKMEV